MEHDLKKDVWLRTCPQCHRIVEHKSKAKCREGERKNKVCITCSRSNIGRRNAKTDICPICDKKIVIPVAMYKNVTCQLASHAAKHNVTPEKLWQLKHSVTEPPKCRCGCDQKAKWTGWWDGYNEFVIGHNANVYSSYEPEVAEAIIKKRSQSLQGQTSWAKGLTKETDVRIKKRGEATSRGLLAAYRSGRLIRTNRFTDAQISELLSNNKNLSLLEIADYKNCTSESLTIRCNKCDQVSKMNLSIARTDRCHQCNPVGSTVQHDIADWIEELGLDVGRNVRGVIPNKQELDLLILAHKFAIEVNGIYWHSEKHGKNYKYHQGKTDACRTLGIKLLHIFDDEWENKKHIIKSMISMNTNSVTQRLMARKCSIIELDPKQRATFFDQNHIDGDVAAHAAWGLLHNDNLVAAISIRRPFHKKYSDALEVARFCSITNTTVAGGLSRLLKQVIDFAKKNNWQHIITYVDERLGSDGNAYILAGFTQVNRTSPRFWWTNGQRRFNRFAVRADKSRGLTEAQAAEEFGVVKIWGCNNLVYELTV